jgi:tryptophan synthase alpha subunit
MSDYYERQRNGVQRQKEAEAAGQVADSMEVRLAIVAKIKAGEITLEEGQKELKRLIRNAKANGQITRNQAFLGRMPS